MVRKYRYPLLVGTRYDPYISKWIRSNGFKVIDSLIGKFNHVCFARGQIVQSFIHSTTVEDKVQDKADICGMDICPRRMYHTIGLP